MDNSRYEKYLAKLAGEEVVVPSPVSRKEQFLAAAAGYGNTPPEPVTREEQYLANIKSGGEEPTGEISIQENGDYDVGVYKTAKVRVPNPSTGTVSIQENGTYNVTDYAEASVSVSHDVELIEFLNGTAQTFENSTITIIPPYGLAIVYEDTAADRKGLKTVSIPAVTMIGDYGFYGNKALTTLNAPALVSAGKHAFHECDNLTSFSNSAITEIQDYCFSGCDYLATVNLPAVTTVREGAFSDCGHLSSVSFQALTSIGIYAFRGTHDLTVFNGTGVTDISSSAFLRSGLINAYFPDATTVGSHSFDECHSLVTVNLPKAVINSGESNFNSCENLQSVKLDAAKYLPTMSEKRFLTEVYAPLATAVGTECFKNCVALESVSLPSCKSFAVSNIQGSGIKTLKLPSCTTWTGNATAAATAVIEYLNLNSLTSVSGNYGYFRFPNMIAISLNSVGSITNTNAQGPFKDCTSLIAVLLNKDALVTLGSTSNIPANAIFYVNDNQYNNYLSATNWTSIGSQIKRYSECPPEIIAALE